MSSTKTDLANIILMLFSMSLALILPFELFLFSYAILGPLHYTTEIAWLRKKQYFFSCKKDGIILVIISCFSALCFLAIELCFHFKKSASIQSFIQNNAQNYTVNSDEFFAVLGLLPAFLVFVTFAAASILNYVQDWFWRFNLLIASIFVGLLFLGIPSYVLIFGILVTTLIHVWLFTALFMLSGAIKSKNISSYISLIVFAFCSLIFLFISRSDYLLSGQTLEIINSTGLSLNKALAETFNLPSGMLDLINSESGLKIQSFIAFAYTYHYLNWFSKVEIIKWHQVSRRSLIGCFLIWILSVSAYAYDYSFGLILLLFLSILHVFLEFPLNLKSLEFIRGKK